jgi:uncharacterized SAM-binding protein YcdF (DUF218 family)
MDVFFLLSKVGWLFAAPSNLIVLVFVCGLALWRWKRTARIGRIAVVSAASTLLAVVIFPVGDWMVRGLEQRFPPFTECSANAGQPIAGILLLGGALDSRSVSGRIEEDLGGGADRIILAARLARKFREGPVLISGGRAFPREGGRSEAEATSVILRELGVPRERIIVETASRTTAENAVFASQMTESEGYWLLVTSAFHMPRSMGTFRKAGVRVIAAPTDWIVDDKAPFLTLNATDRLGKLDLAVKEYLGLLAYRVTGRTATLIPGPGMEAKCG